MFASTLFADESDVRDFDLQIQNLLRIGQADEAAEIIETALRTFGEDSHPVVPLCLACPVEAIEIVGWDALAARIAELDTPDAPILALGVDLSWPGHIGLEPDQDGCLEPNLETNFYTESAFPFGGASREALLRGYGSYGAEWQGGMAEIDTLLSVRGLGQVYGMVYPLVGTVLATAEPDPLDADAMRLGAAFVAVRVHQAVASAVRLHGLPRPLAVIVGSNESYPFYDAPVFSTLEAADLAAAPVEPVTIELAAVVDLLPEVHVPDQEALNPTETEPETDRPDEPRENAPISFADYEDRVVQISGASLRQQIGEQRATEQAQRQSGGLLRRLFAR